MTNNAAISAPPWLDDFASQPLVTGKVKDIATDLFDRIARNEFSFGTRLPAERDLSEQYRESRATIRQSLDFLTHYGIVSRRGGSGTFAAFQRKEAVKNSQSTAFGGLDIDILAETTSPFAMNIAVSIVAPEMIRLATIYMSTRDLATLKKQLEELETIVTDAERFSELESAFMQTIARGTHNALVEVMYSILNEVRRSPQWAASRRQRLTPMKIKSVQLLFRSLYQAMERRNVETAVETIKLHIANSHEEMLYES